MSEPEQTKRYRTLFLSDIHLGARACQAQYLVDFLRRHDADTIYLVGDIIDFWRVRRGANWPQANNDVIQKLLRKVRKGSRLIYIPGNHDDVMRPYCPSQFGGIEMALNAMHTTADGRRFLIMHGDEFDVVVCNARWLALLGDWAYVVALGTNTWVNWFRRKLGLPYWSLSAYLKQKVKSAVSFVGSYEKTLVAEAQRQGADGIICGHIHHAAMRQIGPILYLNTGDWVESCTALGETYDGKFELIHWLDAVRAEQKAPRLVTEYGAAA